MSDPGNWLRTIGTSNTDAPTDGLVLVNGYRKEGRPPEEVAIMEKAAGYQATAVFFQAEACGRPPVAQAFVYASDGPSIDSQFAELHRRLWSWGGVPLIYRKTLGLVQLFRCAHQPDFDSPGGELVCRPVKTLDLAARISADPWWDAGRLRNGSIWEDEQACRELLAADESAHRRLVGAIKSLSDELEAKRILPSHLRRRLLILSLLIAYLEDRGVLERRFFSAFKRNAQRFFEILRDGKALLKMLKELERRFNGNVFKISPEDSALLEHSTHLDRFAKLIDGYTETSGQRSLWKLYSFRDLPVELVSNIYQLFVKNETNDAVYTPPFLVRMMLEESLGWERLDRLEEQNEVVLDPSCGSGVFLVEAYKRLILHFRSRNQWRKPTPAELQTLLSRICGIDIEKGAIELAAFSLCLALCDALDTEVIEQTQNLFPALVGKGLYTGCFFELKASGALKMPIGAVVGNPPFKSSLETKGAQDSYKFYESKHGKGSLPDKQVAYLFLNDSIELVKEGGVLCMLQPCGFLYNQQANIFRHNFFQRWNVREILDFISIRGLFKKSKTAEKDKQEKGPPDTKVVVVVAEALRPIDEQLVLHATFRRTSRVAAEQGFDIDSYDMHWLPHQSILDDDGVFRCNLLGGARVQRFVARLKRFQTLRQYAESQKWDFGEGFNNGRRGSIETAGHIIGKAMLPSAALTEDGLDRSQITTAPRKPVERPRSARRFTPPILLVRETMDIPHALWTENYLTYGIQLVGFCAPPEQLKKLELADKFLNDNIVPIKAYIAATSPRLFTQKATSICADDIYSIPFPEDGNLDLSDNEKILLNDIVEHYRDFVRLGQEATAMKKRAENANLLEFSNVYTRQINGVYKNLHPGPPYAFAGCICQPFVFGEATVDWAGAETLRDRLDTLLRENRGTSLSVSRCTRIYDNSSIYLLKPDRLRYWLPSVALRDADDTLADLRGQGF